MFVKMRCRGYEIKRLIDEPTTVLLEVVLIIDPGDTKAQAEAIKGIEELTSEEMVMIPLKDYFGRK